MVQAGKGSLTLFNRMRTTMSMLNSTSDFSASPTTVGRSLHGFGRSVWRAINNAIAAIIAQREHQAQLTVLRHLSDRELRDMQRVSQRLFRPADVHRQQRHSEPRENPEQRERTAGHAQASTASR